MHVSNARTLRTPSNPVFSSFVVVVKKRGETTRFAVMGEMLYTAIGSNAPKADGLRKADVGSVKSTLVPKASRRPARWKWKKESIGHR
jgi:hypothetical protein